jgi:hypothetical protein
MTLDEAIQKMMTCATAHNCAREEACFEVVRWAKEQVEEYRTREALLRAAQAEDAAEEIAHYAPHFPPIDWETARPDWSAA